jgi:hemerythrin-like domain-containing protein
MKITEALFAEHQVFHSMFDHIEATVPRLQTLAEVKALAALMEGLLKAHSDTEDELFLGPLDHCFEQMGQRESFMQDHQEMDDTLRRVRQAKRLLAARALLLAAVARSRCHFDQEERIVFPLAERVLKTKTLTSLGQLWMEQRTREAVPAQPSAEESKRRRLEA